MCDDTYDKDVSRLLACLESRRPRECAGILAGGTFLLAALVTSPLFAQIDNDPVHADDGTAALWALQCAYESLAERVGPTVVSIRVSISADGDTGVPQPFAGSGVILRADGMILTSQHVIDGASTIHVILQDGRRLRATLVADDKRSDLAVLRVAAAGLPVAELGDVRDVRCGHIVLALGNPLGLSGDGRIAVSQGLVSAIGRPLPDAFGRGEDRYYGDMIQTSARVGPGNSGGPLVDIYGRVIGVVTALGSPAGSRDGSGFAVPIGPHTKEVIRTLLEGRRIQYGYLGVQVGTPEPAGRAAVTPAAPRGARLHDVLSRGPADRAGLRRGDLIITVNGTPIRSADHLIRLIGAAGPGRQVEMAYIRDGKIAKVTAKLDKRRSPTQPRLPQRTFAFRGALLGEVDPATRNWSNLPGHAWLVMKINENSPAQRAGLTPGDVIVRVEGNPLTPDGGARLADLTGDVLLGLTNGNSVLVKGAD